MLSASLKVGRTTSARTKSALYDLADSVLANPRSVDSTTMGNTPGSSPTGTASAAPPLVARLVAVAAILVAGLCGGLIGFAVMDLQCTDGCTTTAGFVGVASAIVAAGGVAIVSVLTLRAMSEWEATEAARAADDS